MSDLVRRVAFRLRCEQTLKRNDEEQARAAIREVAEWLGEQKHFDGDGKGVVAAALRQAAGGEG